MFQSVINISLYMSFNKPQKGSHAPKKDPDRSCNSANERTPGHGGLTQRQGRKERAVPGAGRRVQDLR